MARISEDELAQLKREVSVQHLAESKGARLKRHGKDLMGHCPFHDDRTPSLVISPDKNLWHCLGACQAGGSAIDWIMRAEKVSFRHAVELLRKDFPSLAAEKPRVSSPKKPKMAEKLERIAEPDEPDAAVLRRVVDHYHAALRESPEALQYLESRGLTHPDLISHFQLGFANRTLSYHLPPKKLKAGKALRAQLQRLGVLRESGHEHLNGSLIVPVFDREGIVVEMYGRKIGEALRPGTPMHLYLPGPHRGVFNYPSLVAQREVILCESLIDAMTFWCAGLTNVTCAYGVEGFTKEHLQTLKELGTERVLIAFDRDDAGDKAAHRLAERLQDDGIGSYRVLFARGMDANEYALKVTPADKSLELAIRKAEWLGKGPAPAVTAPKADKAPKADEPETSLAAALAEEVSGDIDESDASRPEPEAALLRGEAAAQPADADQAQPAAPPLEAPVLRERPPRPADIDAEITDEQISFVFGDRRWRIRGMKRNLSFEQLRVNVLVARDDRGVFHVDTLELYSARQRGVYLKLAAEELGVEHRVLKRDLGRILLKLEALQEEAIHEALEPKKEDKAISEAERDAALTLLKSPDLLDRITTDFDRAGVVGENVNKLVGYLAATSRLLDQPLAIVIQSSSAAGKSSLMEAVLSFIPDEQRVAYSAMTGQSLFYMGEMDLKHKVLAIAEEEGAKNASYALKLLQSEGELTIASTGKDPASGRLVTQEYRVQGPVMLFLTTTAIEVDEELMNRCLVLTVDEGREQTRAIHEKQRHAQTLEGLLQRHDRGSLRTLHQNAQRLLRPLLVANPFAKSLRFIDTQTRTRRDHMKYLTLIRAVALLHQYQRELKTVEHEGETLEYIEVTEEDIRIANQLAHGVLGRSLDELPPQTRRLLGLIHALVLAGCERDGVDREDFRFTRRDVREATGWGNTQLKVHMKRLEELEYLHVHRGRERSRFVYELVYAGEGQDGSPFLSGLTEPAPAEHANGQYDTNWSGPATNWPAHSRPVVGQQSGAGQDSQSRRVLDESTEIVTHAPKEASKEGSSAQSYGRHAAESVALFDISAAE